MYLVNMQHDLVEYFLSLDIESYAVLDVLDGQMQMESFQFSCTGYHEFPEPVLSPTGAEEGENSSLLPLQNCSVVCLFVCHCVTDADARVHLPI